jgi:hypothetical protein
VCCAQYRSRVTSAERRGFPLEQAAHEGQHDGDMVGELAAVDIAENEAGLSIGGGGDICLGLEESAGLEHGPERADGARGDEQAGILPGQRFQYGGIGSVPHILSQIDSESVDHPSERPAQGLQQIMVHFTFEAAPEKRV